MDPHPSPPVSILPLPASPIQTRAANHTCNTTKQFVHSRATHPRPRINPVPFFASPEGREAGLRVLQYVLRFIFYLRRHRISSSLLARLLAVVSTLSAMRRLVALIDLSGHLYRSCDPFRVLHPSKQDKGKAKEGTLITPPPRHPQWQLDPLLHLLRQTLDLTSTVADNVFLLARLHLLPLSTRATHHADRIADYATLLSSGMGLLQVAHSRRQIWAEGRAVRRGAIRLEERLETYEYWEGGEEKVAEEKRLRERVRNERRKLKKLREELNELWWERLRLFAEAVFSTYDVLELQAGSEAIKSWAGLTSAGIMVSQAWGDYAPPPPR